MGPDGKLINALPDVEPPEAEPQRTDGPSLYSEDDVKRAVADVLERVGFQVDVAWGRTRGIDIDARHPDGRRYVIEAKGEVKSDQQQGNYFLGAFGELIQRMDDPAATYALAFPHNRRYVGLVDRLPDLVWERLGLHVFWLVRDAEADGGYWVREQDTAHSPPARQAPQDESEIQSDEYC